METSFPGLRRHRATNARQWSTGATAPGTCRSRWGTGSWAPGELELELSKREREPLGSKDFGSAFPNGNSPSIPRCKIALALCCPSVHNSCTRSKCIRRDRAAPPPRPETCIHCFCFAAAGTGLRICPGSRFAHPSALRQTPKVGPQGRRKPAASPSPLTINRPAPPRTIYIFSHRRLIRAITPSTKFPRWSNNRVDERHGSPQTPELWLSRAAPRLHVPSCPAAPFAVIPATRRRLGRHALRPPQRQDRFFHGRGPLPHLRSANSIWPGHPAGIAPLVVAAGADNRSWCVFRRCCVC